MSHNVPLETDSMKDAYYWAVLLSYLLENELPIVEMAEGMVSASVHYQDSNMGADEYSAACTLENALRKSLQSACAFVRVNQPPLIPGIVVNVEDPSPMGTDLWNHSFAGQIVSMEGIRDRQYVYGVMDADGNVFHVEASQLTPQEM